MSVGKTAVVLSQMIAALRQSVPLRGAAAEEERGVNGPPPQPTTRRERLRRAIVDEALRCAREIWGFSSPRQWAVAAIITGLIVTIQSNQRTLSKL